MMPSVTICQMSDGNVRRKRCNVADIPSLRDEAAALTSKPKEEIRLIWRGQILSDTSDQVERLAGSIVNIVLIPASDAAPANPTQPSKPSDEELQRFQVAFSYAVRNPSFLKVLRRLHLRYNLDSLAAACPGLEKDFVAQVLLTRPELLLHLLYPESQKKMIEKHPALYEAANNIAAAIHEEQASSSGRSAPPETEQNRFGFPSGSFLDEMSDEEMEEDDDGAEGGARGYQPAPQISTEQLAAALASVSGGQIGASGQHNPFMGVTGMAPTNQAAASASSSAAVGSGSRITTDMFQAAMQQALMGIISPSGGAGGNAAPPPPSAAGASGGVPGPSSAPDWSSHLATMREMGIVDEGLATRALEVMGGNLQAAVDLIFSGWLGDDSSMQ